MFALNSSRRQLITAAVAVLAVMVSASPAKENDSPHRVVRGRVNDEQGGPVPGAQVELILFRERPSTLADSTGHFSLPLPAHLNAAMALAAKSPDGTLQAFLLADAEQSLNDVSLVLRPPREIVAHVVDTDQEPVADAKVFLAVHAIRSAYFADVLTDATGTAILRFPADAEPSRLLAMKPGVGLDYWLYNSDTAPKTEPYSLSSDVDAPPPCVLHPTRAVRVTVVDDRQQPMAGATVHVSSFELPKKGGTLGPSELDPFRGVTDAAGQVHFELIPADATERVNFSVEAGGYFVLGGRPSLDMESEAEELTVTLAPLAAVRGRVTFSDGRPAPGALILAAGDGYSRSTSRQRATANEQGNFELRLETDLFYAFAASLNRQASALETRVVHAGREVPDLALVLQPATRVFGQLTNGPNHEPALGEYVFISRQIKENVYQNLPAAEQLPKPQNSSERIAPQILAGASADEQGRFECFVGPGPCSLRGRSIDRQTAQFDLTGQAEQEVNLHGEDSRNFPISGRAVMHADPRHGVFEAAVASVQLVHEFRPFGRRFGGTLIRTALFDRRHATTDRDGAFESRRWQSPTRFDAQTQDRLLAGHINLGADEQNCQIYMAPTESVHGRLIDGTGRGVAGMSVGAIQWLTEGNSVGTTLRLKSVTNPRGEFVVAGLSLGDRHSLMASGGAAGNGRRSSRGQQLTSVEPERPGLLELGDITFAIGTPPDLADFIERMFASRSDIGVRFADALNDAQFGRQPLVVVLADHESAAAWRFGADFLGLDPERDGQEGLRSLLARFTLLMVDTAPAEPASPPRRWARTHGLVWPDVDDALFAVFDEDGRLRGHALASDLTETGELSCARVARFLGPHLPEPGDAEKLLDEALQRAKQENKRVLIEHTEPFSAPCLLLRRLLTRHATVLSQDYVRVTLGAALAHGPEVLRRIRPDQGSGTPWLAVLDADGSVVATGDSDDGNAAYPITPEQLVRFKDFFRRTSRELKAEDIERLFP